MHDPAYPAVCGCIQHVSRTIDVDTSKILVGMSCFPVHRGNVVNNVAICCCPLHGRLVCQIAGVQFDSVLCERSRLVAVAYQRPDFVSAQLQRARQMAAREARRPSHHYSHFTLVTAAIYPF